MKRLILRTLVGLAVMVVPSVVVAQAAGQAGSQAAQQPPPLSTDFMPKPYTVGPDDRLSLRFFGLSQDDTDMNSVYLVQPDGTIQLKYVNSVKVQGLTVLEIRAAIMKLLVPEYYQAGVISVDVTVAEERLQEVQVQGHVVSPGAKQLKGSQMTVNRAIFNAGGFSTTAGQEVEVQRDGKVVLQLTRTQLENGDDPQLVEGDTVSVKVGTFFFVNGEVQSTGKKPWEVGMTVSRAVALSGGMTSRGKYGHIQRQVKHKDGSITYEKIKNLKPETLIQPDDELVIARKWFGG